MSESSEEENVTLDNWKPNKNKPKIIPSKWRQEQIRDNFNQQPGIDELHKIQMFLKKKASDYEIMHAFGINAETLIAIKNDRYCPISGISLDNQSKIYKEFRKIQDKIDGFLRGLNYIADAMFIDRKGKDKFKKSMKKPKKIPPSRKQKVENNEKCSESEEICEKNDEFREEEE